MKQLGIQAKFMGGDGVCSEQMPVLSGDGLIDDMVICAEPGGVEEAQKKMMGDFRAAFRKKFNGNVQIYAPYAYDATQLMIAAMQNADSVEPAKYLQTLQTRRNIYQ